MQPLISPINHESRHNSYRAEEVGEASVAENTPLLRRFPPTERVQSGTLNTIIVTFLIIILVSGVIIGIYLLILQSRAENVLPPVDTPLQMVSRVQWEGKGPEMLGMAPRRASEVIVVQTGSKQCYTTDSCSELLRSMQNRTTAGEAELPYNFLISSNGQTFEALGWRRPSPLFPQHSAALVLAFIGNFSNSPPTAAQLEEAKNLLDESISRQYLSPSYVIFGKSTKESPTYLYSSMETMPQWRKDLTD